MADQKDAADKKITKSSLLAEYVLFTGIVRLILLAAVSFLPPLQIGFYDSKSFYTGTQTYSGSPLKVFVPYITLELAILHEVNFLFFNRSVGQILAGLFVFQIFAALCFDTGFKKKIMFLLYPMYWYIGLEFFFLSICCYYGIKFSNGVFFPRSAYGFEAIGQFLCGVLIFIFFLGALIAYFNILNKHLKQEVASIEKKDSVNLEKVV